MLPIASVVSVLTLLGTVLLPGLQGVADEPAPQLKYNRDIRPILSDHCFRCHGLDEKTRKAGLRLDDRQAATRPSELGGTAIVPGSPDQSELVQRIFSPDDHFRMPPADTQKTLSETEKQKLRLWIEQGAEYEPHWSLIPPSRRPLPAIPDSDWPMNPIDYFTLARLHAEKLSPTPEADRATLIRRVTLDLTGLPPTPQEVAEFVQDSSADAYDRVVDRLLSSPRYGERFTLDWLDAARFADTHGYHIDSGRDMTRWRDWVIRAFNSNMPFDQFTIEQIAGDLLPDATVDQKIASGFNRNHMINYEGGAIPEEYHTAYIVDRVNTTGTVWLGLTVGCAQCHDHKYDPISQRDYYSLYAFFHNVPENGLDGRTGNAAPLLKLPSPQQRAEQDQLTASIQKLEQAMAAPIAEVDRAQASWELEIRGRREVPWMPLTVQKVESAGGASLELQNDKSIVATGSNPATETYTVSVQADLDAVHAIRLEAIPDDRFTARGPGRSVNGNIVLTEVRVAAGGDNAKLIRIAKATADFSQKDFSIDLAIDGKPETGWAIHPEVGKQHAAVFQLESPLPRPSAPPAGETDSATKPPIQLTVTLEFHSKFPQHQLGRFRLSATDSTQPHAEQQVPANILAIVTAESASRSDAQQAELRNYYRSKVSPAVKEMNDRLAKMRADLAELEKKIPTTMIMQEMEKPRDTFMLVRGQYDKKGEQVSASIPAALGRLPADVPLNRLGLARWLVDESQPLTARVIVNRFWQMYFGTGIVKTAEDFGSQGEWPSHPDLLDWLASEFRDTGWNVKHLQRLIVTSATYRQSSAVAADLFEKDPENRLLARGPRLRLQAEFIRDQALMISGLLNGEIGGSSVSPYQPPGIWEELAYRQDGKNFSAQEYAQSHGDDLYRRTMYTFIKRTAPPPTLVTFDAPDRETCTVRRSRTNTPLQALILMNDPTYVEASRKLAERLVVELGSGSSPADRIRHAFSLATARMPTDRELALLERLYQTELSGYRRDAEAALGILQVGESPRDERLDPAELAAWTMVVSVILNLDETVTKG